jgi:hypothetical protein
MRRVAKSVIFSVAAGIASLAAISLAPAQAAVEGGFTRTFTDPSGDSASGPDITKTTVSVAAGGLLELQVDVANRDSLSGSESVFVYFDTDANPSTGDEFGDERLIWADVTGVDLLRFNGSAWVLASASSFGGSFSGGQLRSSISRADVGAPGTFDVTVASAIGLSEEAQFDLAPNTGKYRIQPAGGSDPGPADGDSDSIPDAEDDCPSTPAGQWDSNDNGCPGPFDEIEPDRTSRLEASGGQIRVLLLAFREVPRGAKLLVVRGSKRGESTAPASGTVTNKLLIGTFPSGTTFTITITKPGWIGYSAKLQITTAGIRELNRRCTPPSGSRTPKPCGAISHGQ